MIIGAVRLTFANTQDGKSTKSAAHKVKDRIWARFKFAAIEIPAPATSEFVIGVSTVGINDVQMRNKIQELIKHLNDWGQVELINDEIELIHFEDIEMERDFEKYNP